MSQNTSFRLGKKTISASESDKTPWPGGLPVITKHLSARTLPQSATAVSAKTACEKALNSVCVCVWDLFHKSSVYFVLSGSLAAEPTAGPAEQR